MRMLVAGAAGAIGLRLLRRLVADGHWVWGLTRSSRKAHLIRKLDIHGPLGAAPIFTVAAFFNE